MSGKNYAQELTAGLQLEGLDRAGVCEQWHKFKPILATAQAILSILFPPAAAVIGAIIALFDKECPGAMAAAAANLQPSSTKESACQKRCREKYERELAECNGDIDCITRATGRYAICSIRCSENQ